MREAMSDERRPDWVDTLKEEEFERIRNPDMMGNDNVKMPIFTHLTFEFFNTHIQCIASIVTIKCASPLCVADTGVLLKCP